MNIQFHDVMAFLHVCLFVYAIGGDIAVYYIGNYLTKDDLSLDERLRVRSMRFIVDMSARTSLVLLLPIGFLLLDHTYLDLKQNLQNSVEQIML